MEGILLISATMKRQSTTVDQYYIYSCKDLHLLFYGITLVLL